ncbi:MAG: hypothetical protein H3Z53_05380 [archaeon]|nr:hypothetical protein [archaeon]
MDSMDSPVVAVVQCTNCKGIFYPHGNTPIIMPVVSVETCPHCGKEDMYIWDKDLHKELVRKKLGLDKPLEDKVKSLEKEIQSLKDELNTIKILVQNLSLSKFEERIDEALEKAKSELKESIDAYFIKQKEIPYRK